MRTLRPVVFIAMMTLAVLSGCSNGEDSANGGDCNVAVRFEATIFRVHSDMRERAPLGASLGMAELVGCGGLDADAIDEVEVYRIKGVSPSDAVAVPGGEAAGLYIREDLADSGQSSWPEALLP